MVKAPPLGDERCAQEPIAIPGSIQPHGVLFVLRADDLTIAHLSSNVATLLGHPLERLLGSSLAAVLGHRTAEQLERCLRAGDLIDFNPMRFEVDVGGALQAFECSVHRSKTVFIVELEPCDSLAAQPAVDFFSIRKPIARLQATPDIAELMRAAATEVQRISGFDRAMVYRFDTDWHGEVVAEATSGAAVPVTYLGLHFPASDIPAQARALYVANPMRLIADVDYQPAPLVPAFDAAGGPIDLSGAVLRSVSPVHLEYLRNMRVRASMSISIVIAGRLWGLIACHHLVPRRLAYNVRAACRLLGDMLGGQLASRIAIADHAGLSAVRQSIDALGAGLRAHQDLDEALVDVAPKLLEFFGAHGLVLMTTGARRHFGRTPGDERVVSRIAVELARVAIDGVAASHALADLVPEAAAFADCASGALLIALAEDGGDYVLLFRAEQPATVNWGGDPRSTVTESAGTLHPRSSFAVWAQTVRGESRHWSTSEWTSAVLVRQLLLERLKCIERDVANERLRYLATHDTLTQLPNREALHELLDGALLDTEPRTGTFAVLFVDLDHFKLHNDSFGHATGDRILQIAAARMQRSMRQRDVVARLGGDEFVVISRELAERDAKFVAEKIRAALAEPIFIPNFPEIRMTASIGIAVFPRDGRDTESLLHAADLAMYRAKERGRDGYAVYVASGAKSGHDRIYRERRVRQGIENQEFTAQYQPIVDLRSGRITAMEALARWNHPTRGLLLPEQFIALAEQSGSIVKLGEAMLRAACTQAACWRAAFGPVAPHISVNVSPRQFRDFDFLAGISRVLAESGLSPDALQLEVTESLLIEDQAHAIATLRALASSGISIAIDDFGSGYSSLSYLARLPVDVLKIDKSFIADLAVVPQSAAIVRAIIAMARSMELVVVAEGVEDKAPAQFLRDEGCTAVQGFLVGEALTDSAAASFIERFDGEAFVAWFGSRAPLRERRASARERRQSPIETSFRDCT